MGTAPSWSSAILKQPQVPEITPWATSRHFALCCYSEPLLWFTAIIITQMCQEGKPEKHRRAKTYYSVYMMLHNSSLTGVNNFITSPTMFVNPIAFPAECLLMMSNVAVDSSHKHYSICWHRNHFSHYFLFNSSCKYSSSFYQSTGSIIRLSFLFLWSNIQMSPIKLYQQWSFILPHWQYNISH